MLHSRAAGITGRKLARRLDIPHLVRTTKHWDTIIRFGSREPASADREINNLQAMIQCASRSNQLGLLREAGVKTPLFYTRQEMVLYDRAPVRLAQRFVWQGRNTWGRDIEIVEKGDKLNFNAECWVQWVDKVREWRTHIIGGKLHKILEKRGGPEGHTVWNMRTGFRFFYPEDIPNGIRPLGKAAVEALGLDFGAVDIVTDTEGEHYVLEVNTAPGLGDRSLETYATALEELL